MSEGGWEVRVGGKCCKVVGGQWLLKVVCEWLPSGRGGEWLRRWYDWLLPKRVVSGKGGGMSGCPGGTCVERRGWSALLHGVDT